ncbi:MAG: trypsin-like peptidase domain-containing protein [Litoreibacter sp.]
MLVRSAIALVLITFAAGAEPVLIPDSERENWRAVGRVNVGGFKSKSLCSGVLISPTEVLTAAHCAADIETGIAHPPYKVRFVAAWHKGDHAGTSAAKSVRIHPEYAQRSGVDRVPYDLALITLKEPISGVKPAPVNLSSEPFTEGPVRMLGYRVDRQHALTDYQGCNAYRYRNQLLSVDCAVVEGTSGAPVFGKRDGVWEVIGIISSRLDNRGRNKAIAPLVETIKTDVLQAAKTSNP